MTGDSRGFTLLEVLLAMSIIGAVLAMLTLSLSGSLRMVEGVEQEGEIYSMAQIAMQRIGADISAAFVDKQALFTGKNQLENSYRADTLHFGSMAHLVFNPKKQRPGPALIGYRLEQDEEDHRQYRLVRADEPLLPAVEEEEEHATSERDVRPEGFVLAENLRSLQFTYFDRQGQEFDSWQTALDEDSADEQGGLPAAVHCVLEFWVDPEQDTTLIFSTRIVLPVAIHGAN